MLYKIKYISIILSKIIKTFPKSKVHNTVLRLQVNYFNAQHLFFLQIIFLFFDFKICFYTTYDRLL